METNANFYLCVELNSHYYNEFIICGVPIPKYSNDARFILKFDDPECYLNYRLVLKMILMDMELADHENCKYEIQRSIAFIKNILMIMDDQFSKRYC